jgi:trimeric autotransporter adhesin
VRVRATGNDEFYYFDNVQVVATSNSSLTAVATVTDILTCTKSSVPLTGSSNTSGVNYSWTGPDGYTSGVQNPTVTTAGIYTLTVTNPTTGCTGTDTALVSLNNTAPGASAAASGTLSCNSGSSVTLSGASSTSGVSYSWTGPNNFTSPAQNPVVTLPGTYNLTVTNPVNGCTSTATATVTLNSSTTGTIWSEDFTLPNGTTSGTGASSWSITKNPSTALFSVLNNEMRISNSSTNAGAEGVWTSGAIDITDKTNVSISANIRSSVINGAVMNTDPTYGDYIRFFYKLDNGTEVKFWEENADINNHSTTPTPVSISGLSGASTLQIVVRVRATGNDEFYYFDNVKVEATSATNLTANATGGALNCLNSSVTLQGSTTASGASYTWTGPNGYSSTTQNPVVAEPGTYTLTVAAGACTATATATVSIDTTKPAATASATPVQLTCTATPAVLTGGSSTPGVTYSWSNAAGVIATTASTSVTDPGTYTLTVSNPANGCKAEKQVVVTQNITPPPAITVSHMGRVTCDSPTAVITGTVSAPGLNYKWTGPEGYTANTLTASVRRGGTYTLTATDPANGCTTSANTEVAENTTAPTGISITNPGSITCLIPEIPLSGFTVTPNATYTWTGPEGYTSSFLEIMVNKPGDYMLKVTDTINGCSDSVRTTVIDNAKPPVLTIINTSPLSCSNKVVKLEVVMNVANPEILWSGPGGWYRTDAKTTTSVPGQYSLFVGDLDNGCSTNETFQVTGKVSGCAREATGSGNTATINGQNAPGELITTFAYKAYPNPVTSTGVIEFTSPENTTVTVGLYNSLGVCEKVLFKGNAAAQQRYKLAVSSTQLQAGAYYYIINAGGKVYSGRLVIVK